MKVWTALVTLGVAGFACAEEKLPSVLDGFKKIQKVLVEKDAAGLPAAFDARTNEMVDKGRFFKKIEKALGQTDAELTTFLKDEGIELDAAAARARDRATCSFSRAAWTR